MAPDINMLNINFGCFLWKGCEADIAHGNMFNNHDMKLCRAEIGILGTKYVSSVTFSVYSNFIYHKKTFSQWQSCTHLNTSKRKC